MAQLFKNNASSTLLASITSSDTLLSIIAGDQVEFPVITVAGDFFMVTLQVNGTIEIVKVTATSSNTFTVSRGQEGTTPIAWSAGTLLELRLTAGSIQKLQADIGTTGVVNLGAGSTVDSYEIWHEGNMGHGGGLDADTVDGIHGIDLAPKVSPALTGVPTAPTAAVDTSTTQIATTGFVVGQKTATTPLANGVATIGSETRFAAGNHVHPTDTTLAPKLSPIFTGQPEVPTAPVNTNTNQIASTAFVLAQKTNLTPLADGIAAIGNDTRFAAGNHVHPADTSKLDASVYTAADVKTKLLTVDGVGSAIDADLLDGQHGSFYQDPANLSAAVPVTKGGLGKTSIGNNNFLKGTTGNAYVERTPAQVLGDIGAQAAGAKLTNITNTSTSGILVHAGSDVMQTRSITSTDGSITIANSTGAGGDIDLAVDVSGFDISDMTGTLSSDRGGTSHTTYAIGDILYASATDTLSKLAAPVSGTGFLKMNSSGSPSYDTNTYKLSSAPDTITSVFGRTGAVVASAGDYASFYQTLDADLTSIAGLAGTSGLLRKTAANTWSLDTTPYLTGNQTINITGAVTGSGTTSIVTSLSSPLDALADVIITTPTINQVLAYNGTNWINVNSSTVTGITEAPIDGQRYERQSANWVVASAAGLTGDSSVTVGSGTTELRPTKFKLSPTGHPAGTLELRSGANDANQFVSNFAGVWSKQFNTAEDALIDRPVVTFIPSNLPNGDGNGVFIGDGGDALSPDLHFLGRAGAEGAEVRQPGRIYFSMFASDTATPYNFDTNGPPLAATGPSIGKMTGSHGIEVQGALHVTASKTTLNTGVFSDAPLNLAPRAANPTSPVVGDMWITTGGGVFANTASGTHQLNAGLTDAPNNGTYYARLSGGWQNIASGFLGLGGDTMTGKITARTPNSGSASIRLPHGSAPSTPSDGDKWTTTAGEFTRINGATKQTVMSGDSSIALNKTTLSDLTATSSSTAPFVLDTIPVASVRSTRYTIQAVNTVTGHASLLELGIITTAAGGYASMPISSADTNTSLMSISISYSAPNVLFSLVPNTANLINYTAHKTAISA